MERVIFLDRDGTLNEEVHYLHKKEDLRLIEGAADALCRFRKSGYRLVVVTNQAGVARGYYQEEDVKLLHEYMNEILRPLGAEIDCFFYCPHHPEHGIGAYKKNCSCRKPDIGMFEQAEQYFQVDKAHSWMIGDKLIDVEAGKRFGVRTVLVGTGYGAKVHQELTGQERRKLPYDVYAKTLADAASAILEGKDEGRGTMGGRGIYGCFE
jgi:D-glycero-D-manno-heptose 1,7-bisphosphate phosphatase